MTNKEFVEAIYKNSLGKAGDTDGIKHWTKYLDSGNSRSDMVSDFMETSLTIELSSENFPNLTTQELSIAQKRQDYISNKVEVALKFITLLGTKTNVVNNDFPENDPAYLASIKILTNITDSSNSVSIAIDFLDSIKNDKNPIERINNSIFVGENNSGSSSGFGGNGGGSGNNLPTNNSFSLSDATIVYSNSPTLNQEFNISIEGLSTDYSSKLTWSIISQPHGSNLILNSINNNKTINLTPTIKGKYTLQVINEKNKKRVEKFTIYEIFTFDEKQIEGNDGSKDIETLQGVIKNQYWVYSRSLSENEIRNIVSKYSSFSIKGWNTINGLLIEIDDKKSIELLKFIKGIASVDKRAYAGNKIKKIFSYTIPPNYTSKFNDGGDNWHLESIDIKKAWEYTTGNKDITIGVIDEGFYQHQDLENKFKKNLFSEKKSTHGTGVCGTLVGNPKKKDGVLGINWNSKLIVNVISQFEPESIKFDNSRTSDCSIDTPIKYTQLLESDSSIKLVT